MEYCTYFFLKWNEFDPAISCIRNSENINLMGNINSQTLINYYYALMPVYSFKLRIKNVMSIILQLKIKKAFKGQNTDLIIFIMSPTHTPR